MKIKEYKDYVKIPDISNPSRYQTVSKKIENSDLFVLCANNNNGKIEIDNGFIKELLEELKKSIRDNSKKIKIMHIFEKYLLYPLEFKHFYVYNELDINRQILDSYNKLIEYLENEYLGHSMDIFAQNLFLLTILVIYKHIFRNTGFEVWFNKLIEKSSEFLNYDSKFLTYENSQIEFKRGDWWKNTKEFLNNDLKEELEKKLNNTNSSIFIFFVGFDEQTKTLYSSRLPKSDVIGELKTNLKEISKYELLNILAIPKESKDKGMIVFIYKQSQNK